MNPEKVYPVRKIKSQGNSRATAAQRAAANAKESTVQYQTNAKADGAASTTAAGGGGKTPTSAQ